MAFVSWASIYSDWLDALANKNPESFFLNSYENAHEMRSTYNSLKSITQFTEWLKQKADQETLGFDDGEIPMAIGGH